MDSGIAIFCVAIPLLVLVLFLVTRSWDRAKRRSELENAQAAYQEALRRLKASPSNAELRQRALSLGREYSNLTRNKSGVTVYDEMALMNDIGAATAGAAAAVAPSTGSSIEDRLKQLDSLREKGVISDREWSERRTKILSEI